MKSFLEKHFGWLVIFFIWIIIVFANYTLGTVLSGWDNLHSEFNFPANYTRTLFAPWQEYQGLGLLGGMGHGADVVRQVFVWLFSLFIPKQFLRYLFHFLMLLVGSLGVYCLLVDHVLKNKEGKTVKLSAVGGGVFYLLNLATLQMFYVPYEPFSTHFGFLPWLFWVLFRLLHQQSRKNWFIFLLFNLLAASQGYVLTVFFVYILALSLVLITSLVLRNTNLKTVILIPTVIILINSFWLLPNMYYVLTSIGINTQSKTNLMSTENNLLLSKKFGDFKDVVILKGFLFNNSELQADGTTDYIMGDWVGYLDKPLVKGLGYGQFCLAILGLLLAIVEKNKKAWLFVPVFFLGFTFLANDAPIFSSLAKLLYKLPLFTQIFRFPFTKFSILTAFCLAIFYGILIAKIPKLKVIFVLLPVAFLLPVFRGKLFYQKVKANIPSEYFEVFNFFKTQDKNTRIANFPQTSYWGWTNYKWGEQLYSGSGFLWYGIQQPILDRAFDVWSKQNENYYWEISYAIYSKNRELFENVLEKYQVNWLILDGNVINPGAEKALFLEEIEGILSGYELAATFGEIKIYQVDLETPVKDFVYLAGDLPNINSYEWGNDDKAFEENGGYISSSVADVYYPFRSLFTGRKTDDLEIEIEDQGDQIIFKAALPKELEDYQIELPVDYDGQELVEIDQDTYEMSYFVPVINSDGKTLSVGFPKVKGLLSAEINPAEEYVEAKNCNQFSSGVVGSKSKSESVELYAKDATHCGASFYLPSLSHQYAYLISAEANNISGKSLLFWLENLTNRKADIEVYLDEQSTANSQQPTVGSWKPDVGSRVIQPPMADDGLGYTLHFDNISIGRQATINELGKISVLPIPYRFLTELKLTQKSNIKDPARLASQREAGRQNQNSKLKTNVISVTHSNPSFYKVRIDGEVGPNTTLVLSQAYHSGWLAYDRSNRKFLEHIKVNNWSNGWVLPANTQNLSPNTYVLFFWPLYLEYLGFSFYLIILLFCWRAKSTK